MGDPTWFEYIGHLFEVGISYFLAFIEAAWLWVLDILHDVVLWCVDGVIFIIGLIPYNGPTFAEVWDTLPVEVIGPLALVMDKTDASAAMALVVLVAIGRMFARWIPLIGK